jgi:hypothetical protein
MRHNMTDNRNRFRKPLNTVHKTQLAQASEFETTDTYVLFDCRLIRTPYRTAKGLVMAESRATVSFWDEKTQTRKTRLGRRYQPVVISGASVEELRAREHGARKRPRRGTARHSKCTGRA